ncbi:hypothetical protein BDW22DRAFT_355577 [Trametopsis cervina]|nr:hypothetical protein BDW22DRAFT_355577 [Trametopsis cervina]
MSEFNSSALIVDDQDPRVQYSSGWENVASSSAEYDSTKSGATSAGQTASFTFTGTGVEVYGSLGSIDVYGRPVTTYSVDGGRSSTYQAPVLDPGLVELHVMFYRSPPLSPGQHTLVITNTNGTKPTEYWLDYIVYTPSDDVAQPPPSNPPTSPLPPTSPTNPKTPPPTTGPSSSGTSVSSASGNPSISYPAQSSVSGLPSMQPSIFTTGSSTSQGAGAGSASNSPLSDVTTSQHKSPAGAIAGGVIGGVVVLAAILLGLLFYRRRSRSRGAVDDGYVPPPPPGASGVAPFGSWPATSGTEPYVIPSEKALRSTVDIDIPHGLRSTTATDVPPQSPGGGQSNANSHTLVDMTQTGSTSPTLAAAPTARRAHSGKGTVRHRLDLAEGPSTGLGQVSPSASEYGGSTTSEVPLLSPSRPPVLVHHGSQVRLHEDSGIRLPLTTPSVVDVPPAYTRN